MQRKDSSFRRPDNPGLIPLMVVLAVTAAWSFGSQAGAGPQDEAPEMTECRATIAPAVVNTGGEASLGVRLPDGIGEITAVRSEKGSGIVVLGFDPSDTGLSALTARLDIPSGAAGAWWLEFAAEGATCRALLTVTESALAR